ncbi:MAG TPA: winged helix-turn-helix domain-containing protein [Pyrinomonadaceae bacterium]|nr:winged helix-turn-helix domain-containing protein [Pyrinomonadaceae bacterium]
MSEQTRRFYDFGAFRLDTRNHRLTRGAETIPLTPKEFEVLFVLIENAGDVVAKDALLDAVWKDAFVGDETLMRNISWLRKKLGAADSTGASFIETVPKRGYRFAATVEAYHAEELIIEEETLTQIVVEETTSISDSGFRMPDAEDRPTLSLPPDKRLVSADRDLNPKSQTSNPKSFWLFFGGVALLIIGFVVHQNYFRTDEFKAVPVGRVMPFSGLTGREDMPAFSPDGKQLAFVWNGGAGEQ